MSQLLRDQWHQVRVVKTAMADRSGHPEIDRLIEEFLKEPLGDWINDDRTIGDLRNDPATVHGSCQEIAEQFVDFAKAHGFPRAYAEQTDLEEMGYTPTGKPHGDVMDEHGHTAPGFYSDHTVASIYLPGQHFPVIVDFAATQYGYKDFPKVST